MSQSHIIELYNEQGYICDEELLLRAAGLVLDAHEIAPNTTLSIALVDDAAIQALNVQHRAVNAPTDVLSFAADFPLELEEGEAYLGDVVIAYPYTAAQAEREGFSVNDSLALMVIHGTLHLLGYDHDTAENRQNMWAAQANFLRQLNIDTAIVPAHEADHDT